MPWSIGSSEKPWRVSDSSPTKPYRPMLATPWQAPFSHPDWSFELKWDGIRAVLASTPGEGILRSRNGNLLAGTYPELAVPGLDAVLDGEIVAMDKAGRPSFGLLQGRAALPGRHPGEPVAPVHFVVFDLLSRHGQDLRSLAYADRRRALEEVELAPGLILGDATAEAGEAFFSAVRSEGLEGMVAKRLASSYQSGVRSPDWRKVLNRMTATVVVGGYLPGDPPRPFKSLVLGLWDEGHLRYVGNVGSGFDDASLRAIKEALDQMWTEDAVFWPDPALDGVVQVEPTLVAQVEYRTWTGAGRLRHAVFKGFSGEPADSLSWIQEGPSSMPERTHE